MKRILIILIFICASHYVAMADAFHVVYIRIDDSMDYAMVKNQVKKLVSNAGDNFVVIYSNENKIYKSSNWRFDDLEDLINAQLSSKATIAVDEIDLLSTNIENCLNLQFTKDEYGFPIIKSQSNYDEIYIHCIVGDLFIQDGYTIDVIERTLLATGLGSGQLIANVIYYPCTANYSEKDIQLSNKYQLDNQPIIK